MKIKSFAHLKRIAGILLALILTCSVLTACDKQNNESKAPDTASKAEQQEREKKQDAADTEGEPAPSSTASETPKDTDTSGKWMPAYRNYLLKVLEEDLPDVSMNEDSENFRFGFMYLNDDDIPEVWYVDGIGAHGASYIILTYRNGKVTEVTGGANYLTYFEKTGVFSFGGSGGASVYGDTFYRMTNSGVETLEEFMCETYETPVYTINGEQVSEEEYRSRENSYETKYGKGISIESTSGFVLNRDSVLANCK